MPRCDFCPRTLADAEYMFRSPVGAAPPHICDGCIRERMSWLDMESQSPGFLAGVISIQRGGIAERWAESHPAAGQPPL